MAHIAYTNPDHIYTASKSSDSTSVYFELSIYQSDLSGFSDTALASAIKTYLSSLSPDNVTAQKITKTSSSL